MFTSLASGDTSVALTILSGDIFSILPTMFESTSSPSDAVSSDVYEEADEYESPLLPSPNNKLSSLLE
jgi:hypothetical protein